MRCVLLCLFFAFVNCKKAGNPPVEEIPFSFIGSWDYSQKIYRFAEVPFTQVSGGLGCNGDTHLFRSLGRFGRCSTWLHRSGALC